MFRMQDFEHVPKAKRASALAHQVPMWSPFGRTAHHCVWSGARAMVWYWDADLVSEQQAQAAADVQALSPAQWPVLPEPVFLARQEDGAFLRHCQSGVELQCWQGGVLEQSTWYPGEPEPAQVLGFLDRHDYGGSLTHSTEPEVYFPEPWASTRTPGEWLLANEWRLALASMLLLTCAIIWQEGRYWRAVTLTAAAAAEFEALQEEVGPLLAARSEVLKLRQANERLAGLVQTPSQALLMSLVDAALPNSEAIFKEWHYQQGELRIIVEDPSMNPIEYVRSLEAQPLFTSVRAEQGRRRNQVELNMRLDPST